MIKVCSAEKATRIWAKFREISRFLPVEGCFSRVFCLFDLAERFAAADFSQKARPNAERRHRNLATRKALDRQLKRTCPKTERGFPPDDRTTQKNCNLPQRGGNLLFAAKSSKIVGCRGLRFLSRGNFWPFRAFQGFGAYWGYSPFAGFRPGNAVLGTRMPIIHRKLARRCLLGTGLASVAALGLWLATGGASAQVVAPRPALPPGAKAAPDANAPSADEAIENVFVPAERLTLQRLSKARELLDQGRYGEAVQNLGGILDGAEDFFFQPDRKAPIHRSVKAEAQRLLGRMPREGRELYELQYGAALGRCSMRRLPPATLPAWPRFHAASSTRRAATRPRSCWA